MDPKEVKKLIKEAKDALKNGDPVTTARNCAKVLRKEPENYQANLLLGTSYREQDKHQQALEAYKKAVKIDPNQVYAWQGIISIYDRARLPPTNDLMDAYKRVAVHFEKDDKAKYIENTLKLANILVSQNEPMKAVKIAIRLATSCGMELEIAKLLVKILNQTTSNTRSKEEDTFYTDALEVLVTSRNERTEDTFRRYFSQLYRTAQYTKLSEHCMKIKDMWNRYWSPMEFLCRLYLEARLKDSFFEDCGGVDRMTDKLFKLHPSSRYGFFARGKYLVEVKCRHLEGFGWLKTGLESSYNLYAALVLIRGRFRFGDSEGGLEEATKALAVCAEEYPESEENFKISFELLFWEGLLVTNQADHAEKLRQNLKRLIEPDPFHNRTADYLDLSIRTALKNRRSIAEIKELIARLLEKVKIFDFPRWRLDYYECIMEAWTAKKVQYAPYINIFLETHEKNVDIVLEAASFLKDMHELKASLDILTALAKTKEGSRHPHTWKYMAQIHLTLDPNDVATTITCLKKSWKLNPDSEVGTMLADLLENVGDFDAKRALLLDACEKVRKSRSSWCYSRLGLMQLREGDFADAAESLQNAIRIEIGDENLWLALGEAYFMRGSMKASLRAFNKALYLGADPVYPQMRIVSIHQSMAEEANAITYVTDLVKENPENPFCHLELAKVYSWVCAENIKDTYDKTAIFAVEKGLESVAQAIIYTKNSPMILPWILVGDYAVNLSDLPEENEITIPSLLTHTARSLSTREEMMELDNISLKEFKEIGTKALLQSLQLINTGGDKGRPMKPTRHLKGYVHHQLALSYYGRARFTPEGELRTEILLSGSAHAKAAIVCYENSGYWNTLGLIHNMLEDPALAQHSFIRALQCDANHVQSWSNLGIFYMKQKETRLAHKSFCKGQSVAPTYPNSWMGQALCAEVLQPGEAPDLFRHSTILKANSFSIVSYGNSILDFLLNPQKLYGSLDDHEYWKEHLIVRLEAVTNLNDLITRILGRVPSPYLYNLKGIIEGFNGFYSSAMKSFDKALGFRASGPPGASSAVALDEEDRQKVLSNKITAMIQLKLYESAKDELMKFQSMQGIGLLNAAVALYKLGHAESAIQSYEQFLSLPDSKVQQEVKIAIAILKNFTEGTDHAKSILFGKDMIKYGKALVTLGAIAVVQAEVPLLNAVIHQLKPFQWDKELASDICFIQVCFEILKENFKNAIKVAQKFIHMYPTIPKLYALASQVMLTYDMDGTGIAVPRYLARCMLKIAGIEGSTREDSLFASKHSGVVSLTYLVEDNATEAVNTCVKAIRSYPEQRDNWAILACGYWMQYCDVGEDQFLLLCLNILDRETELLKCSEEVVEWMKKFRVEIARCCSDESISRTSRLTFYESSIMTPRLSLDEII